MILKNLQESGQLIYVSYNTHIIGFYEFGLVLFSDSTIIVSRFVKAHK